MYIEKKIFSLLGWSAEITNPLPDKCVICIAPHTSNWDFIYGILFKRAFRLKINFFIKKEWMTFPFGLLMRRLGGIGIDRKGKNSITDIIAKEFEGHSIVRMAITPEGTRSLNKNWKKGFYYIALKAKVPVVLGTIDYKNKKITINDKQIIPNGDIDTQMAEIKSYYNNVTAKNPNKFGR